VAAWTGACLFIVLFTTNPAYKALVLAAAFTALAAGAGVRRMHKLLKAVAIIAAIDVALNFISAHLGKTALFALPDNIPAIGGTYTLEALAFGTANGITVAAAILAAAALSLLTSPHDVMEALPKALSRTGTAIAASMNLVPAVANSFTQVSEAQRMRGWQPKGPRSWAEVVVPVVLTSVEGSIQLAESMEARGFGSGPRTSMDTKKLTPNDWLLITTSAIAVAVFTITHIAGWAVDWYPYPSLTIPELDTGPILACLLLFTPAVLWRSRA
jgi:energy-coupling factor transport system permease protein